MGEHYDTSPDTAGEPVSHLHNVSVTKDESNGQSKALFAGDPFSSETSKLLFDAMNELRGCGVGQDLDLPQVCLLVVIIPNGIFAHL
jgi:hypothetical protein